MPGTSGAFTDLGARFGTGIAVAAIALVAVWIGGAIFTVLIALAAGALIWELARMLGATHQAARWLAAGAALVLAINGWVPPALGIPLVLVAALIGAQGIDRQRAVFLAVALAVMVTGLVLIAFRADHGVVWTIWLLLVVVATDVAGYFAGRLIGGRKIWPRISPKKTWAGTAAGWIGAALIGTLFARATGAGMAELVGWSVALSLASQIADVAESAVKRSVGVKDSSNILPGHGGLMDRFDGIVGAVLLTLVVTALSDFPPGAA
ncbi:MAG: phosphatidate cytidylyltransferase [Pseudomonadota bacterium]